MSVLINFKICDNAPECGGLICPTGAISYSDELKSLVLDNEKCITCGLCEKECPIGAIHVACNDEEYAKIKKEIDDDPRRTKDLFVDRYGAAALSEFFITDNESVKSLIAKDSFVFIEMYNSEEAECLLKSIPIKELTEDISDDVLYYKLEPNEEMISMYNVSELPSLLIFKSNELLGQINGYYEIEDLETIKSEISKIVRIKKS